VEQSIVTAQVEVNRRTFLRTGAATGGALVVGFYWPRRSYAQDSQNSQTTIFSPNAWVRITADSQVTILVEKPEMGQGQRTVETMLLAEELEVDFSAIRIEQAPTVPDIYKSLSTGGSGGTRSGWDNVRKAGAQARETLVRAAAQKWSVDKKECRAESGAVIHVPTGRRFRYGELVEAASKLPEMNADAILLKEAKDFCLIGKSVPRVDTPSKVDGTAEFGIDVRVPGMLYAVIARCPHFGGRLVSFDGTDAKQTSGVRAVFPVAPLGLVDICSYGVRNLNTAGGVAVVADSTWAAIQGRTALKINWDKGPGGSESTNSLRRDLERQALAPPTFIAVDRGEASKALDGAAKKIEATYELPFTPHATMEPMNTTAHVRDGEIELWSPTQWANVIQDEIATLAGLPKNKVIVHMTLSGGSFGRRAQWDYAAEAWQVAREVKQPVQLMWTREDDIQHDFYREYGYHRLTGGFDQQGQVVAWSHRVVSTPIRSIFDSPESLKDPQHSAEVSGADPPYSCPNVRIDFAPVHSVAPRAWWRSVQSSFTAFAVECFIDELAHAAGRDPYEFRVSLLNDEGKVSGGEGLDKRKFRGALQLAAEKAGWGNRLPPGWGRGIACHWSFGSYIAHVAEVSVEEDGTLLVRRVVSAVDCGTAVNPDGVRAMAEGAINFALTPVLGGEITIKEGAVEQSNFHDCQVLCIHQSPVIEVHIVPSIEAPQGMGEPGVPPLAPAVANAVFAATGVRVRRLPIDTRPLKKS
jgi:isoquinoline 1-oxidoreductase beta subunit